MSAWRRLLSLQPSQSVQNHSTESNGDTLCSTCRNISFHDLFNRQSKSEETVHWELATVRNQTHCRFCRLLRSAIDWSPGLLDVTQGPISLGYMVNSGDRESDKWFPHERTLNLRDWHDRYSETKILYHIVPMGQYGDSSWFRSSRMMDPHFFNLGLVREWLETCTERHSGACIPTIITTELRGVFRLIDVAAKCLVQNPPSCEYLALSYVWGDIKQPNLQRLTLNRWTQPGAFDDLEFPNTITDAMELTRQLGRRYLWIDCLCIVQDDQHDKLLQISQMHSIYRSAWLTIIAGSGSDSNAGLPGLTTRPRLAYQRVETIQGLDLATVESDPFELVEESVWNSRAWTFQEKLCSSRCLIITDHSITFWCTKTTWREDLHLETQDVKASHHTHLEPISAFVDNTTFITVEKAFDTRFPSIMSAYLLRKLTYPSDILRAFAGISQLMSPVLGQFISGLPSNWFYRSLCWEHKYKLIRRPGTFPSWCWSGWMHHPSYKISHYMLSEAIRPVLTIVRCGGENQQLEVIAADSDNISIEDETHSHFQFDLTGLKNAWAPFSSAGNESIVLLFYTSSTHLLVGPSDTLSLEPWDPGRNFNGDHDVLDIYPLLNPTTKEEIGTIVLDKDWYMRNCNRTHEFVVVARHKMMYQSWENDTEEKNLILMLIERNQSGWSERVQLSNTVKEWKWWNVGPKKSLIILA